MTARTNDLARRRRARHSWLAALAAVLLAASVSGGALAWQRPLQTRPAAQPPASPIGAEQALYLVRSTLMTLNDANRTGNYTVLRDLSAPDFQAKNTAADLAMSFADLRRRNFDLFVVALIAPEFPTPPALDASGRLRLTGFFPTRPLQIRFDLTFQSVSGRWRLYGISVATPNAPPA